MRIFTSYFGNLKALPEGSVGISIALKTPVWFPGPAYPPLMPRGDWLKMERKDYEVFYMRKLRGLHPVDVREALEKFGRGKDVVLLCYESLKKPGDWCHRRMVAEWLEEKLKIEVPEVGSRKKEQLSLWDSSGQSRLS